MLQTAGFRTFAQMIDCLPDDKSCREYLENLLWQGEPVCPHCGSKHGNHFKLRVKGEHKGLYKCSDCRERFTVTVGTIFEQSHIGLRKWFIAIYIFSAHKKGISSHQLARDLGVTQKTAWFMLARIRYAFKVKAVVAENGGLSVNTGGVDAAGGGKPAMTQVDETFIGGKNKNRHDSKKIENAQGRSTKDKVAVMGLLNESGEVQTRVIPDTKASTLKPIIKELVREGSIIVTDEWGGYNGLDGSYEHVVVSHKDKVYVRDGYHTNGIENFWSNLKKGVYGIYHSVSKKHLVSYCDEFSYRYNTRKLNDSERFVLSLNGLRGKLNYKVLINNEK